ncbi:MAG: formylglycine-generating enzyme family protein [Bacteroidota bacterium]|nr:formylglycine-generating enzyme family protein [Bacteroidota bacterium]
MKNHFYSLLLYYSAFICLIIGFNGCKKDISYPLPDVTTNKITVFNANSATVGGIVISDRGAAVSENGIYIGTSPNPEKTGQLVQIATGIGTFTKNIIDLTPNTKYYIKAYATNSRGTAYGKEQSYTTSFAFASITTNEVTGFISNSAICGGNIASDGGSAVTERGVCWDTNINPTITLATRTVDGSGIGSFNSNMTGLQTGINYYVRAYATNKAGTAYGPQQTFTKTTPAIEVVLVQGGTYQMGSPFGNSNEKLVHDVTVSDFYIGKYEVTQDQWNAIMGNNPSYFQGNNAPVESVSWNDVQIFINKLNSATGKIYRLPTEAEWEFAAKGGIKSKGYVFAGGNILNDLAWNFSNSYNNPDVTGTRPVGSKLPNELGVYDMSGNVNEFCNDWYGANYSTTPNQINPTGPLTGLSHVSRGGSIYEDPSGCRTTSRSSIDPNYRYRFYGFRLALSR